MFRLQVNVMARHGNPETEKRVRFDRILYFSSDAAATEWGCTDCSILGNTPLAGVTDPKTGGAVFPSDHFGLLSTIGFGNADNTRVKVRDGRKGSPLKTVVTASGSGKRTAPA